MQNVIFEDWEDDIWVKWGSKPWGSLGMVGSRQRRQVRDPAGGMSPCARKCRFHVPGTEYNWEGCGDKHTQLLQESTWDFLPRETWGAEQRSDVVWFWFSQDHSGAVLRIIPTITNYACIAFPKCQAHFKFLVHLNWSSQQPHKVQSIVVSIFQLKTKAQRPYEELASFT